MQPLVPWAEEFSQIAPKGLRVETWTCASAAHCCDMCHFLTCFPPPENQIPDFQDRSLSFTQLSDYVLQRQLEPVICLKLGQEARSNQNINRFWLHLTDCGIEANVWS